LNRYYDPYYACGYTQLVSLEKKIDLLTHNLFEKREEGKAVSCSKRLDTKVYHHFYAYGKIPEKDVVELLVIRVYPGEYDVSSIRDFERSEEISVLLLNVTKVIG